MKPKPLAALNHFTVPVSFIGPSCPLVEGQKYRLRMVVRNHRSYQPYHTAVEKTSPDHWRYFAAQAFDFGLGNSGWRNFSNEHSSVSLFLFSTFVSALAVL